MTTKRYLGRLIHAKLLPKTENGYTACRWCEGDVLPPKRTMCSPECVHEILIRTNNRYMREFIYNRDKGICSMCNIDTKKIAKTALSLEGDERKQYLKEYKITLKRKIWKRKFGGGLWDADHIVAVKDGGGCCGADNIRTLCISCHKTRTANDKKIEKNKE